MKKLLALILALVLVLAMAACSKVDTPAASADSTSEPAADTAAEPTVQDDAAQTDAAPTETAAAANDISTLKIGAFSNSGVQDGGYTQAFYTGLKAVMDKYGMSDDQLIMVENIYDGTPDVQNIIQQLINEGCNVIIGHSNGYNEDLDVYARKYPDIRFYCYEGGTSDAVCTYTIHNHQAIYELGYLCALMSEGDELGFIAPMQNAHIIRSIDAFALGAKAANENAKVKVMWVNSWWDAETDKLCAETLISEGVTAMAYYGSTSAALQACQEKGVYCTGFHIDMHDYAPDACMSSFCWNWEPILTKIVERYLAGDTSMDMLIGTVADGSAAIAPLSDFVPDDVKQKVADVQQKITDGEIDVFAGPVYDNEGNLQIAEGSTLSEEDLFSVFYLVDNVIGTLD